MLKKLLKLVQKTKPEITKPENTDLENTKLETEVAAVPLPDDSKCFIQWSDLDRAAEAFKAQERGLTADWEEYRYKYLPIPEWYNHGLDPLSEAYRSQQDRIWQMMIGENANYDSLSHELTDASDIDALKAPGLYSTDVKTAGEHLIAMGHVLKRSGLHPGNRALEYGAGFGQIALALARLGVTVDTVDIDETFCKAVQAQADWFGVDLKSYLGQFGDNPSGLKYDLILFYEAFHHARDFAALIEKARDILVPGGKIILAGEPLVPAAEAGYAIPYPWGIRLTAEVGAVVRIRRWYELGFQEEFLLRLFNRLGFGFKKYHGHLSNLAIIYEFVLRPAVVKFSEWQFPPDVDAQWHYFEPEGRWTKGLSTIPIDCTETWTKLKISCQNYHPAVQVVNFSLGDENVEIVEFKPGEFIDVMLNRRPALADHLTIETEARQPSVDGNADKRHLGIFVKEMEYIA